MSRLTKLILPAFLFLALLPLASPALRPKTEFVRGHGFKTWMAPLDAKAWRMEQLLFELRQKDETLRIKALRALGFERHRVGRELLWPVWQEPIKVEQAHLGFNRRFASILSVPYAGRVAYGVVVFFQDGQDQNYWKPWQIFEFDTDPIPGLELNFPDILDDQVQFLQARHLVKDDIYGNYEVVSVFRFDDRGEDARVRLTWAETDEAYRSGKFQGDPMWEKQKLKLGNQRIERAANFRRFRYTQQGEENRYQGLKPYRQETAKERFSWNPADFSFYDAVTELEKLVNHKSPEIRRQAARRLGAILSTTHSQLELAARKDKSAYVRMQAVLALAEIGDPKALKSLLKAQANPDEDDTVLDAVDMAIDQLQQIKKEGKAGENLAGGVASDASITASAAEGGRDFNPGAAGEPAAPSSRGHRSHAARPSAPAGTTFTAEDAGAPQPVVKASAKAVKKSKRRALPPAPEAVTEPKANLEHK
jgi:hypothetical protein